MGLIFQYVSIAIELLIALMGILIVLQRKKKYGWFIFITFFIYVFYDSSKILFPGINQNSWNLLFFIATLSAFVAVWQIFQDRKEKDKSIKKKGGKKK